MGRTCNLRLKASADDTVSSLGESASLLLPSTDWIRSSYKTEGCLLYSESANCNVNPIQNEKTFIETSRVTFDPII